MSANYNEAEPLRVQSGRVLTYVKHPLNLNQYELDDCTLFSNALIIKLPHKERQLNNLAKFLLEYVKFSNSCPILPLRALFRHRLKNSIRQAALT